MKKTIASLCVILVVLGAAAWVKRTDIILAFAKYQSGQRYADVAPTREILLAAGARRSGGAGRRAPAQYHPDRGGRSGLQRHIHLWWGCGRYANAWHRPPCGRRRSVHAILFRCEHLCAVPRAMIMTGRYPTRTGFEFTPTPDGMIEIVSAR